MPTHVALLYSVTLPGGGRVVMSKLKAMATELGLGGPQTVLATGNLVFDADAEVGALEASLEAAFERSFGRHVDIIVREASGWRALLEGNPFPEASETDASHVITRVQRAPVPSDALEVLTPYVANGERVAVVGGDLWVHFARDIGHSKLAAAMTPRRLGVGTSRNWNTMKKIGELLRS